MFVCVFVRVFLCLSVFEDVCGPKIAVRILLSRCHRVVVDSFPKEITLGSLMKYKYEYKFKNAYSIVPGLVPRCVLC